MNIYEAEFEYDEADPEGYRVGEANVGRAAGGTENNVRLYQVPPGEHLCPYHYEYIEEWALVVEGSVQLRGPGGVQTLQPGALVCFPRGPEGAHKLSNTGERAATVMMWSSAAEPAVAVYPDSDKIGVWPGNTDDNVMVRRADGKVDYWVGES